MRNKKIRRKLYRNIEKYRKNLQLGSIRLGVTDNSLERLSFFSIFKELIRTLDAFRETNIFALAAKFEYKLY